MLQEKALDIAAELVRKISVADGDGDEKKAKSAQLIKDLTEFKASRGWLDRWKQRFNVVQYARLLFCSVFSVIFSFNV